MESTSAKQLAGQILACCLDGTPWPADSLASLLDIATAADPAHAAEGSRALFSILVERLGDLFEPRLSDAYAELFSEAIVRVLPEYSVAELVARYRRVREIRPVRHEPRAVFVLSRVTLGADIAVTSVALDGVKRRFPGAQICYVGPRKGWELFAADPRIRHVEVRYERGGTLAERLAASRALGDLLAAEGNIVVDPDSRLSQLGLVPVCREEDYYFFESRAYGGDSPDSLPVLAARWMAETFGVDGARAYIAPHAPPPELAADVAVSLGVGENPAKRIPGSFEEDLLRHLAGTGLRVLVDTGAGGEETERVMRAIQPGMRTWRGAFAPFAAQVARSRLYIGYDSAGQHVAAASGVPLVSVFAGEVSERMFARWRPAGPGRIAVIRGAGDVLGNTKREIDRLLSI